MEEMQLVEIVNKQVVCDSLQVAERFHKRHDTVLRAIDNLRKNVEIEERKLFCKTDYKDDKGRTYPKYIMNRKGFTLLIMGFTGDEAKHWQLMYSDAFDAMEAILHERQSEHWQLERKQGKLSRKAETDALKELVACAEAHGSKNAKMLYITYSKLANATVGIKSRDLATAEQFSELSVVEQIILKSVKEGIRMQMDYHDIYKATKERLTMFRQLAYLV